MISNRVFNLVKVKVFKFLLAGQVLTTEQPADTGSMIEN